MEAPFFSVIIPTYARPQPLKLCLEAVSQLNYPRDRFEVIVVNDGDPNFSYTALAPYDEAINIRLISQKNNRRNRRERNRGPASARNIGACNAVGDFLVFTDDSCQPSRDWLSSLAAQCKRYKRCAIGGEVINALPDNLFSTVSQMYGDAVYAYFNQQYGDSTFLASCNFAVPRGLYQELGGFDTSYPLATGEDREFCDRWLREGHSMLYAPDAQVYHAHHLTLPKFLKQHFNYGKGAFLFHKARKEARKQDATTGPVKTDFKFYGYLMAYPFRHAPIRKAILLVLLFFSCNVAKTVGFFWSSWQYQLASLANYQNPNQNPSLRRLRIRRLSR